MSEDIVQKAEKVILSLKEKNERKKLGGKLIRVNYKFSKEFDD